MSNNLDNNNNALEILNRHINFSKDGIIERSEAIKAMQEYASEACEEKEKEVLFFQGRMNHYKDESESQRDMLERMVECVRFLNSIYDLDKAKSVMQDYDKSKS